MKKETLVEMIKRVIREEEDYKWDRRFNPDLHGNTFYTERELKALVDQYFDTKGSTNRRDIRLHKRSTNALKNMALLDADGESLFRGVSGIDSDAERIKPYFLQKQKEYSGK